MFDLDGTIIDSSEGIHRCANAALAEFGHRDLTTEEMREFVGPPLAFSFERWGVDATDVAGVVAAYRRHYESDGLYEYRLYDGIVEVIGDLHAAGYQLAVATLKPERFAEVIIEDAGLASLFSTVAGAGGDHSHENKAAVIRKVLERLSLEHHDVVMIGDREHDTAGATEVDCRFIGVTWGFGSDSELRGAGATHVVHSPDQLIEVISSLGE
jgi:phosphoglycolate phosphatase